MPRWLAGVVSPRMAGQQDRDGPGHFGGFWRSGEVASAAPHQRGARLARRVHLPDRSLHRRRLVPDAGVAGDEAVQGGETAKSCSYDSRSSSNGALLLMLVMTAAW